MKIGTYADGRDVNYDDARKSFDVGGSPVTADQVDAYSKAGQVTWTSEDTKAWFEQNLEGLKAQAAPAVPDATPTAPAAPVVPPAAYVAEPAPAAAPAVAAPVVPPAAYAAPTASGGYPPPSAPVTAPKKNKWLIWVIIGVVVLVLACGACALIFAFVPSDSGNSSSEKSSEPAAETETESGRESLPTGETGSESEEAEVPTTGFTQEEIDYSTELADISLTTGEAATSLGSLLVNDPEGVVLGGASQDEARGYIDTIQYEYQEALLLEPPASMQEIHDAWLAGLSDYNESMNLLLNGIDYQDAASFDQAATLLTSGSEKITTASELLTEFQASRQ